MIMKGEMIPFIYEKPYSNSSVWKTLIKKKI